MIYFLKFVLILFSLNFAQKFDPETGQIIKADTSQIRFNPNTGELYNVNDGGIGVSRNSKLINISNND